MPAKGVSFLIKPTQAGGVTVVSELTEPLMSAIVLPAFTNFIAFRVALQLRDDA
jgi:hypothetical protein